jgi:hypothetical protein
VPFLEGVIEEPAVRAVVRTAFWAISAAVLVLVQVASYGTAALGCAFLTAFSLLAFAYCDSSLDDVLAGAGTLAAALLALWSLPSPVDQRIGLLHNLPPEEVGRFLTVAVAFGLLLGAGGFAAQARVPRPSRWAALSAAAPPILLAVSYWRVAGFGLDLDWMIVALALAALELAAARWAAQRRDGAAENELVLTAYAVGVLGCTILAAVFVLENAWLTVTLALHLPALAWVEGRLRLPVLRHVALGIAATVLVRLILNPEVLRYALSDTLIFNWLLYGYGTPAAAFMLATRQFGSRTDDLLVKVLEAGSIVFSVLLVSFELWHALSDRPLRFVLDDFALNAVETIAWLAMAGWLLHLGERRDRVVLRWSGVVLFAIATVFEVGWQAIFLNPVMPLFGRPVEGWLLLDSLFLAYLIPAALYATIGFRRPGPRVLWQAAPVSRRRLRLSLGDARSPPFLPRRPLEPRRYRRSRMVRLLGRLARLYRGRARGGAQMAQPLAAPRVVARPRPGRRQSVSVGHGRSQRRVAGAFLHRSRPSSGRHRLRLSAAAAIAAQSGSDLVGDPHPPRYARHTLPPRGRVWTIVPAMVGKGSAAFQRVAERTAEGSALAENGQCRKVLLRHLRRRGQDGKAAASSGAVRFPVGFPLDLNVILRPRLELEGIVFPSWGSEGLHRKPVLSGREIMKKSGSLLNLANGRAIRIDYRPPSFDISRDRVRLAEKPHPRHPGFDRRNLHLRGRHSPFLAAAGKNKAERAEARPFETSCLHVSPTRRIVRRQLRGVCRTETIGLG